MYEKINRWYIMGLWTEAMVQNALKKGVISQAQYDAIISQ